MTLLTRFRARQRDMKTLSRLISTSLERAGADGGRYAGAHDLISAALELDDGTAKEVFEQLGTSGEAFAAAVDGQDAEALRSLGLPDATDSSAEVAVSTDRRLGKSDATYEAAVKNIYAIHNERGDRRSLVGAHIVAGVAEVDRGVAARAFATLGLDRERVVAEARTVADRHAAAAT